MRFLRIPSLEAPQMPEWIIDGLRREEQEQEERREAPRLEIPQAPMPRRQDREQEKPQEPLPGSTVIVIDL